jgi:putative MATE family efflux protein
MDRSARLGEASIPRLLFSFAIPAIVGTMAQALYYAIDRAFVGHALGTDAIAGITVALPFMFIVLAFAMLIGFGGTALISIRLGEQKKAEAERVLGNMAVLLVIASVFITAAGLYWLDDILVLFGAEKEILPYAQAYLRIIAMGAVCQMVAFGLNAAIRGEGNPRIAMLSMLISVALNVILAWIFIFRFSWGMQGAALATVISQAVTVVWVVGYFVSGKSVLRLHFSTLRLDGAICRQIVAFGSPPCAMQLAGCALQTILNHQVKEFGGKAALAVWGILFAIFMTVAMPIIGLNQGAQPIIGYNYGARQFARVKRTLEIAILAATCLTVVGFTVMMLFPAQVISLFNRDDKALLALGTHAIRLSTLMLPLVGFQIVSASYFQAVGKPKTAMLLMLSRQLLVLIPAALVLPHFFGLDGVWAALPTSDFASSLLTGVCLLVELRRLKAHGTPAMTADELAALAGQDAAASSAPVL